MYTELIEHVLTSTKASLEVSYLLVYVTIVQLVNGTRKVSTDTFILHWIDQARS